MRPMPTLLRPRGRCGSARAAAVDLEWFWPSRRGNAFDQFCR